MHFNSLPSGFKHLIKTGFISTAVFLIFGASASAQIGCVMACNDQIQITVPSNGSTEFLPEYMLEGNYDVNCPNAVFQAQLQSGNDWIPATGNFVFLPVHIGNSYVARIRDQTSGNACWGNVQVVGGAPLGVKSLFGTTETGVLSLTPNPASQSIQLKIASNANTLSVRITDMQGRELTRQSLSNGGVLDISGLNAGMYIVTATTLTGEVFSSKFKKQD